MDESRNDEALRPTRTTWAVALVVALAGYLVWQFVPNSPALLDADTSPRSVAQRDDLTTEEKRVTQLFQTASPSVVYVRNRTVVSVPRDVGGTVRRDPTVLQEGTGSGFIWTGAGFIVTNYHVIHVQKELEASRQLEVTLSNHESFAAQVVGQELEKDIAVLKIEAPQNVLPPIAVGSSSDLLVGQSVYAIGNPFSLDQTLTHGIISGLDRDMPAKYFEAQRGQHWITGVIQTDAAINPGNSGGPLLDSAGRLIGMNTAIKGETGENTGVGFAVPVDTINRIVTDILRYGQARRPGLGVTVKLFPEGVAIHDVFTEGGAARAGLKKGTFKTVGYTRQGEPIEALVTADLILGVNGKTVRSTEDLFRELDRHQVGEKMDLLIQRAGEKLHVEVELSYLPPQ
jgi:S1-C subfamily serine protease